jgi:imidazolonepropionase-like amidohydrolase
MAVATLGASAQQQTRPPAVLALTGGTIIDGSGAPAQTNMTLVIENGRITQLFRSGERPLPSNASVHDLSGHYVIPGLIDAHVHVGAPHLQNGTLGRLLRGGVTTVRNMVGNCSVLSDMSRRAAAGEIDSPDIYYSAVVGGEAMRADPRGRASGRPSGTGPGGGTACGHLIGDSIDVVRIVTESKAAGAVGIKLYADISTEVARRISEEAHRQGLIVWAHAALFPPRPSDVVQAGADVLSHAAYLIWEAVDTLPTYRGRVSRAPFPQDKPNGPAVERVLKMMAERNVILDATLHLFHAQATNPEPSPNEDFQVDRRLLEAAAKWADGVTRRARELGVLVSAGTDGQGAQTEGSLPNLHVELQLLVQNAGFSPLEAIRSATSIAARTMRLENTIGTVAVGKQADLVVLRSDPTADIRNTKDIAFVIKRGRVIGGNTEHEL